MTLLLDQDYERGLRMARPTYLPQRTIRPPKGALGSITVVPPQTIPPINTNIAFSILPRYKVSEHPGLAAIDSTTIPDAFNWKTNGGEKSKWIADPGNQMLCGSCWAISTAGVVADNYVISGKVNWKPHLSTTWCLSCYPQHKCQGGNPALLLEDISRGGIVTENCIDYSWCAENPQCSGIATKHFEAKNNVNLSTLVPSCGCYDASVPHYLFTIEKPQLLAIGEGMPNDTYFTTVKKHILKNGPVLGGFLVFKNFRSGSFTKVNGGVYLENCQYDTPEQGFDPAEASSKNYIGSHSVAVLGWGIQRGVVVDNNGTKKDVPYWYCRNSWTDKWGDNGYFKMAMYPYNKISQFDRLIVIEAKGGRFGSGGMVLFSVSKPPVKMTLKQLADQYIKAKKSRPDSFYSTETEDVVGSLSSTSGGGIGKIIGKILIVLAIVATCIFIWKLIKNKHGYSTRHSIRNSHSTRNSRISHSKIPRVMKSTGRRSRRR